MKATLLFLSFLLLSFSSKFLLNAAADPVYDYDGDALQTGREYHIYPLRRGDGGGVTLATLDLLPENPCPPAVVQSRNEADLGSRWTFRPVDSQNAEIQVGQEMNIHSSMSAYCRQLTTLWRVEAEDPETRQIFIRTTGGDPSPSNFRIERDSEGTLENVYKITHNGNNVGRYRFANGLRRLAVVNESPFQVVFFKADRRAFKSNLKMV